MESDRGSYLPESDEHEAEGNLSLPLDRKNSSMLQCLEGFGAIYEELCRVEINKEPLVRSEQDKNLNWIGGEMLIIGELLNPTRKKVKQAPKNRDEAVIRRLAHRQIEAGADILDVNTVTSMKREIEDMGWVIGLIYDEMGEDMRLSSDSPNLEAIAAGLTLCKAWPMVNSISNDPKVQKRLILLLKDHDAEFIGLTMGEKRECP